MPGIIYVKYQTDEREFYDLQEDPYQLENHYDTADPALLASLQEKLVALKGCAGDGCREAENAAP
jgi:N-acetylglucosamine-6-sulfatase